jgi:uncharacterized protein (DUF2252 family)
VDVVGQIRRFNEGRSPDGLALKFSRMRGDAFSFLRGSCHLFNARLSLSGTLRNAPSAWACGDLHADNFGCYKGALRQLCFDIVDFDEALLAPAPWDALHLLTSLDLGLPDDAPKAALTQAFVDAYGAALAEGKAGWVDVVTAPPPVRTWLEEAGARQRPAFLDTRTVRVGRQRGIRLDNGKAWPATAEQKAAVQASLASFAAGQDDPRFFEVIDIARRITGTGSLGRERYIVVVRGKGSPDGNHLLDLKRAQAASGLACVPQVQPDWAGEARSASSAYSSACRRCRLPSCMPFGWVSSLSCCAPCSPAKTASCSRTCARLTSGGTWSSRWLAAWPGLSCAAAGAAARPMPTNCWTSQRGPSGARA